MARGRWRLLRNSLLGSSRTVRSAARRAVLGGMLALTFGALVCLSLAGLFAALAAEGATSAESGGVLALIMTVALFGLLVFDLHEAVSTVVQDSDLELLRRAPVPGHVLFIIKLADALPRTSLLLVALAFPAVIAYHAFYPLPAWAWAVLPLQLLALWAIPLGAGTAIAIHLLRRVPARRAREALGLLSTLTLLVLWLANSFLLPRFVEQGDNPMEQVRRALTSPSLLQRLTPGHWAAEALAAAAAGSGWAVARATGLLLAAAALALGAAAWAASRHLETVQSRIAAGPASPWRGGRARGRADAGPPIRRAHATVLGAVVARDAHLWLRDWTVLGDVLTVAVLWTLLPLVGAPLIETSTVGMGRAMLIALTVGLGYEVAARALPFERRGAVWMRLAPVSAEQWVGAKLAATALLATPILLIAAASMALTLGLSAGEIVESLCVALPALGLALSVGLWTGAHFGNMGWTNPRAMLTLTGRLVATGFLLAQAGGWLALVTVADANRAALPPGATLWGPALLALPLAALPLRAAAARLSRRDWTE